MYRLWRGVCQRCGYCDVCERCKCCVDCGVAYVSGVGAVVRARLVFFDEEPFAVLAGTNIMQSPLDVGEPVEQTVGCG